MAQPARAKSRSSEAMRLKAQKKTDFEQEFYQSLFSEALDGIFVCDQRGKYLNVNPRGRQMLGYTRREILRMSLSDVIPPEDLKTNPIRMTDLLAGKTVVNERRLRCKNGRLLHVEISAWMLSNGNLVGIVRDISEQKATEETIRSLARFPSENPNPVLRISMRGKVLYANDASQPLLDEWKTEVGKSLPVGVKKLLVGQDRKELGKSVDIVCGGRIFSVTIMPVAGTNYVNLYGRDATERRLAQKKLTENESRFRALIENAAEMIIVIDKMGLINSVSPSAETIMGYKAEESLGKSFLNWIHPEDLAFAREALGRQGHLPGTSAESVIVRARHKNGEWRSVEVLGTNLLMDPIVNGIVLNARDVTTRVQEDAVREARLRLLQFADGRSMIEFLRATLDELERLTGSQVGFYHLLESDQQTLSLQAWSTRTLQEFCTAEGEGRHYSITEAGVWVDCIRERRAVIHNDYATIPHRKGLPDGHAAILRELVTPVFRNGQIVAIIGVGNRSEDYTERDVEVVSNLADLAWDIAERKQAEDALRASEERYRSLYENSTIGIYRTTPDGHILLANPALISMLGYDSLEELKERNLEEEGYSSGFERKIFRQNIERDGGVTGLESAWKRKDGRIIFLRESAKAIRDASGRTIYYEGTAEDITEQKRAEIRYHSLFNQLHDAIFLLDLQGRHIQTNQRAADMLGYTLDEIHKLSFEDTSAQPEASRDVVQKLLDGENIPLYERVFRKKNGDPLYAEVNVELVRDWDGKPLHIQSVVRDITERRRAELALRASETRYRTLIEQLPAVVYLDLLDGEGTTLFISPQVEYLLGVPAEEWLKSDLSLWAQLVHPEDRQSAQDAYFAVVKDHSGYEIQYRMIARDGRLIWIQDKGSALQGADGQWLLHGVMFDITDRMKAEEKLQLQSAALEAAANTIVITDRDGRIEWTNPSFKELTGIEPDQATGKNPRELIKSGIQDEAFYKKLWDTILSGHVWHGELVNRKKDGELYKEEMTVTPLRNEQGEIAHFIAIKQNISDRKQAEEALRVAEAKYRAIFEGAVEGIYQSTPDGRFLTVNPALARMWGYDSPEDLIASVQNISQQIYVRPRRREEFVRLLEEHGEARGFEYEAYRKDGEIIWASENARAVKDKDGAILYYEGNIEDITEQKWADSQIKRMLGIVNASLNEIYVFNSRDWLFEYVNLGAQTNLGYSLKQLRLMTPLDIKPELTEQAFRKIIAPLVDGRESLIIFETVHRRADGTTYPVEVHLQLVGQEDDKVFLAVIFDITERVRSQEALRESEERIQNIMRHSSSMFYAHTPDHVLTFVSPQSREILDCEPEEAMVRWQEFISDHPVNAYGVEATERAIQTGQRQPPYELELLTHKGRTIWVRVDESPVTQNGRTVAIVGSLTDITDRKQAEQALRESENLLREAQSVSGLGSYMLDIASGVWKSSIFLDRVFGIEEAYERTIAGWEAIIHPDDREKMSKYFSEEVAGQGKNFDMEYRIRRVNDQAERWVHGRGKLEFDSQGRPIKMHGAIQDITDRKRHEHELEAEAMLAQALSETLELQPLLDQLLIAVCHAIPAGEKGSLALMTDDNHLEVRATHGYRQSNLVGFTYSTDWGFGGRAIRQRRPILVEDIELDAALQTDASATKVDEIRDLRSAIAVPLLIHETAIGVLSLESSRPGAFNEKDLRLLVNFATSAALIIERARLFDETRRHATETATLLQTSLALTDLDLETTLQTIGMHASALFETDACRIFLTDEAEEDTLRCVLALGENQSAMLGLKIGLGKGVTGDVAAKGQAEIVNNMGNDPRAVQVLGTPEEEESIMFAPLKSGEQVIGVMSVKRLGLHRPFTPSDLELLKAFASMSASAVSNARLFEETRQRLSELTTIHQTAQRLTQLHTPDLLAQEIVKILEETLHYEYGAVMLVSEDGKSLKPFALSNQSLGVNFREQDKAYIEGLAIQKGRGITGWVVEHGQSVRLGDAPHDPRYLAAREGIQSELCVPLRIGERVIGIVNVESRRPNSYSESDQRVLETIAAQIAISINNADLFEGTRQQVTELEMLYESGMGLSQTLSPKEIGGKVIELLEQKMGWHHTTVRLYHPQDDTFELLAFNQPGLDSDAERREVGRNFSALVSGPGKGLSGWAFQNLQIVRCGDVRNDPRFVETYPNLNSGLYVPIRSGQKAIGVLSIESEQPNAFNEADERLAVTLANQAASALENARLFEEVRQRVAKLETINRVSIALRAITNQKAILAIVLEEILKALNLTVGSMRIWNPETRDLRQEAARGWTTELGWEEIKPGDGIIGKVFESGETYISRDFYNDPLTLPRARHKMPRNWGGVCTTISSSEEPLGVLLVAAPSSREFNKEEVRLLNTLAEMTGAALHRMNLLNETIRRAREFEALYETSRVISAEADLNALLDIIVKSAIEMLGATGGGMYLYDVVDQEVEVVVAAHISVPLGARLKLGEGLAGRVAQTREPIRIEDYSTWEGRSPKFEGLPIRAALEVPILYGGELIGVLVAEETGDSLRKFSEADERLLTLFASQAAGAIKSARLHDETIHRLKQLQALRVIDRAIAGSLDKRVTLNILVDQIISQLDADAADVLLLNPYLQTLQFAAGHGFRTRMSESTELHIGTSFAGRAVLERRIQHVHDADTASRNPEFFQFWNHEGFSNYHAVPLIAKGQVIGVIEVFHRAPFQPDLEWANFLETLADQTAIALDNAQMFENVQSVNMELSLAYEATIEGWSRAMDLRDEETEGHTQRVAEMAVTLARVMGFDGEELLHMRRGALLHDIGKIGVPDHILHKKDELTEEEWQIMRQHPKFAYEMLLPISYLRQSLDIPYKHHERWDGSGYPQGLAGDHIPLVARIFSVVDVYDALTSDRPYRKAWTHEQTIQYIREQSGKQFDPFVVEKFMEVFGAKNT